MRKFDNFCRALENLKKIQAYSEPFDTVTETGIVGLFGFALTSRGRL